MRFAGPCAVIDSGASAPLDLTRNGSDVLDPYLLLENEPCGPDDLCRGDGGARQHLLGIFGRRRCASSFVTKQSRRPRASVA